MQYSSTLGVPDSVYAQFDIISNTCHPAPCYLNSNQVFLLLSNQYHNPDRGFEPGSSSECLLEFDTCSKPLGHHGQLYYLIYHTEIFFILGQKRKSTATPKVVKKKPVPQINLDSSPEPMKKVDLPRAEENTQGDFAMYVTRRLVKSLPN